MIWCREDAINASCWRTWFISWFLKSVLLSDNMYLGQCEMEGTDLWMWILWCLLMCLVLGKPQAILWGDQWWWRICLFLKWKSHILWLSLWLFYQMVIPVSLSFAMVRLNLGFSLQHSVQLAVYFLISLFMPFQSIDVLWCFMFSEYVQVAPWWPSLSYASMSTVYFYDFGMTRAKNFWFEFLTCLYSNPLLCRKRSTSILCFSILIDAWRCICSSACNLSLVSSFGVASDVSVTLGISV